MPLAARISDDHTCPKVEPPPHVGGPIVKGSSNVLVEDLPAARAKEDYTGDFAVCAAGGPDYLAQGCLTVLFNDMHACRAGDLTQHGGVIVGHAATVEIGVPGDAKTVLPIEGAAGSGDGAGGASEKTADTDSKGDHEGDDDGGGDAATDTCTLTQISAACEHDTERKATNGGVLAVVPDSNIFDGDTISLGATVGKCCAKHPVWSVDGKPEAPGPGASFDARCDASFGIDDLMRLLLRRQEPPIRRYAVDCEACDAKQSLSVHAYPPGDIGFKINSKLVEYLAEYDAAYLAEVKAWVRDVLGLLVDEKRGKVELGSPSIGFTGGWKEGKDAAVVEPGYSVDFAWDPILTVKALEIPIGSRLITRIGGAIERATRRLVRKLPLGGEILSRWLRDFLDWMRENLAFGILAGLDADLGFSVGVDVAGKDANVRGGGSRSGRAYVTGELKFFSDWKVVKIVVTGETKLKAEMKAFLDTADGPGAEMQLSLDPFDLVVDVAILDDIIQESETFEAFPGFFVNGRVVFADPWKNPFTWGLARV